MREPVFLGLCGGGVNGIAHLGILMELSEAGYFDDTQAFFVGTSVGALNLLGVALNFTKEDYLAFLKRIDFPRLVYSNGYFDNLNRFFGRFGANSGRYIHQLVNEEIKKKTGLEEASFEDLHRYDPSKHFYVTATNISKRGIITIFSYQHTPKVKVADAIQASTAVPFLYSSVRFKEDEEGALVKHRKGDHHIDGGIVDNFILHFFDSNRYVELDPETADLVRKAGHNPLMVGIYLLDDEEQIAWIKEGKKPPSLRFSNIVHYGKVVSEAICYAQKNELLRNPVDVKRIIFVNTHGNPPFNFTLDQSIKDLVTNSGRKAAKDFLIQKKMALPEEEKPVFLTSRL